MNHQTNASNNDLYQKRSLKTSADGKVKKKNLSLNLCWIEM